MIPATAIIVTKEEGENLAYCLLPLVTMFARVVVVDSESRDETLRIAREMGAEIVPYVWNGHYPKKRQWSLQNIEGLGAWVFFIDADEIASAQLLREMELLFARGVRHDGYFVRGRMAWMNKILRFGMFNNKLCLFRRDKFAFPEIDDLGIPGMGEIEGHYQPVPIADNVRIGQLFQPLTHYNRKGRGHWQRKHDQYAAWEAGMTRGGKWPVDPIEWRQELKMLTRDSWLRPYLVFMYCYVLRGGFLDGIAGLDYAIARAGYARNVIKRL